MAVAGLWAAESNRPVGGGEGDRQKTSVAGFFDDLVKRLCTDGLCFLQGGPNINQVDAIFMRDLLPLKVQGFSQGSFLNRPS